MTLTPRMKDEKVSDPVYEAKDQRNILIRIGEKILTIFATVVLWIFIALTLHHKLFAESNASLLRVWWIMALAFVIAVLLMVAWQFYNWFRYHNKARRRDFRRQTLAEVGKLYGISAINMARLQKVRNVAVVECRDHHYYYCIDGERPIEIRMLSKG